MYQVNDMYLGVFMLDSLYIQNNLHSHRYSLIDINRRNLIYYLFQNPVPIHVIITCNQLENLIQYKYLEIEMKRMPKTNHFTTTTN